MVRRWAAISSAVMRSSPSAPMSVTTSPASTGPVGYADGLARELSNNMDVLVNGRRARQVGNICMDQFMFAVDVNPTRSYRPTRPVEYGDVVTVLGADDDERITAEEMAGLRNTINYEVVCDFGMRLEKIYT